MKRHLAGVVGVAAALGLAATAVPGNAHAVTGDDGRPPAEGVSSQPQQDNLPDPLHEKRSALHQTAVDQLATGEGQLKGKGSSRKIEMADGTLVGYPVTQTAQLLTFLVEFGDTNTNASFPGQVGPAHDQIPEPGASDNHTDWKADFSPEHYKEMFFSGLPDQNGESFAGIYNEMSSGRFKLQGDVSDWIKLDKSEASYQGADGGNSSAAMTSYIQDTADAWYQAQLAQGKTKDEIVAYLTSFDVWDRYDADGDGITNEPDGYIDHFQAIHAGEGEEAGAPKSAIWSHRWGVNQAGWGKDGPAVGSCAACAPLGGIRIGDTDLWIRDYTTEPENGGLGVFAHEFGHDLGLPDFYDTAPDAPGNGTASWTLMSGGSWLGHGNRLGTTPNHIGPSEKLVLGWYGPNNKDLQIVDSRNPTQVTLGPSYHATNTGKQAALVRLPSGSSSIETGPAASGSHYLYSGSADGQSATATSKPFTVPAGADVSAKVRFDLEHDYDFTYLEASTDGSTWTPLQTNLSEADPALRSGIDGTSDSSCTTHCETQVPSGWVDLTADLAAYEGRQIQLRFRTTTDGGVHYFGFAFDDVAVGSALTDDFEAGDADWGLDTYVGITGHSYQQKFDQSYMVENRQYRGYDTTLKEGPYNFGFAQTAPDKVEHFPFQDGLLVWYRDGNYTDNNTSAHPGYGQSLPVDANARALRWPDGTLARNSIQPFDATFDVDSTDAIRLHRELTSGTQLLNVASAKSSAVFDDSDVNAYWDPANPAGSSKVAGTGTVIKVISSSEPTGRMVIQVGPKAAPAKPAKVQPAAAPAARTALSARAPKVRKRGKKFTVRVTVTSPGRIPAGTVTVSFGHRKVTATLIAGHATVKVRATGKKGKRKLVLAYRPSTGFTGATQTRTIRVK